MKKVALILLILTLVYFQYRIWAGQNSLAEIRDLQVQLDNLRTEIDVQRDANAQLEAEVRALRDNGSGAMEEQIRERLGRVRDNETLYLFVDDE